MANTRLILFGLRKNVAQEDWWICNEDKAANFISFLDDKGIIIYGYAPLDAFPLNPALDLNDEYSVHAFIADAMVKVLAEVRKGTASYGLLNSEAFSKRLQHENIPEKEERPKQFESDFQRLSSDGKLLFNDAPFDAEAAWKATKLAAGDAS